MAVLCIVKDAGTEGGRTTASSDVGGTTRPYTTRVSDLDTVEPTHDRASAEWGALRGRLRHRFVEAIDIITILLQDAVILVAGFLVEFAYERWLRSSHPSFQLAVTLSSALFLLLYGITVTVHVVGYVRGQFGAFCDVPATAVAGRGGGARPDAGRTLVCEFAASDR